MGSRRRARVGLAYGAAGIGLATTLAAMAALHPHQQVYFNTLVDTKTPGALGKQYDMDYWRLAYLQSLEYLIERYPDGALRVWLGRDWHLLILPQEDRARFILLKNPHAADFYLLDRSEGYPLFGKNLMSVNFDIHPRIEFQNMLEPPIYAAQAYGSVITSVVARDVESYRAAYDDVAANGTLLAHSDFDIYAYDGALYYLSDSCDPPMSRDAAIWAFLHIFPDDPADLSADGRELGFENMDFRLDTYAAFFDGKCMHRQPLSDYPIARIRTGQSAATSGGNQWRVDVNLAARAAAHAVYESIAAGDYGQLMAQSDFDVYRRGNRLAYLKENCEAGDMDARFFLHIIPANPADLPANRRESGFENRDFLFDESGARIGDKCVAERELPDYAIERIRTGQFVSGEGQLWSAEFPAGR